MTTPLHRTLAGVALLSLFVLAASQEMEGDKTPVGCVAKAKVRHVCPRWKKESEKYVHPDTGKDYDIDVQEVPCESRRDMKQVEATEFQSLGFVSLYPGLNTSCGHGNREFYFMARESIRGRAVPDKVMIAFMSGGWCSDALTCGISDLALRTMAKDSIDDLAGPAPAPLHWYNRPDAFVSGIFEKESSAINNKFGDWALVVVPDCTGDMHMGNRSYTYSPNDPETCITAHHHGAANAGAAVDWLISNFPTAKSVLVLGTSHSETSKASGALGAAVWAPYIQRHLPNAVVRAVMDSSMGVFGPEVGEGMKNDPWGTGWARGPDHHPLLPMAKDWHIAKDDFTALLEQLAVDSPSVAYADVSSVDEPTQVNDFVVTGGKVKDCCLNGCGCDFGSDFGVSAGAPAFGVIGGMLDWTKSRKVQVLRRLRRLPNHYRSWLHQGQMKSWMVTGVFKSECARPSHCPAEARLGVWLYAFATGKTEFHPDGSLKIANLPGGSYGERAFGLSTCAGCLDGILGSASMTAEACNATLGDAETLFTVAPKFGSDWMALWSLNGWDEPDVASTGTPYRFGHEYLVREGESVVDIAARFGTSVEELLRLNWNLITHVKNPARVKDGDTLCIVPHWSNTMDQMGQRICPGDGQRFGEEVAQQASVKGTLPVPDFLAPPAM